MAKVMTMLEQACAKLKPALDPSECQLIVHEGRSKRVQDLLVPFRLANIPGNARIEIERGDLPHSPGPYPVLPSETLTW